MITSYKNGNYLVNFDLDSGTKYYIGLRSGEDLDPDFPDSIDIKLTNRCYYGCPFCHEDSSGLGEHGDLGKLMEVISNLPAVPIELALGGGTILTMDWVEVERFFKFLKGRGHRIGITITLKDVLNVMFPDFPLELVDSVGLSLDLNSYLPSDNEILQRTLYSFPNLSVVIHVILGTFSLEKFDYFIKEFNRGDISYNRRLLLLGYKSVGRGAEWENKPGEESFEEIRRYIVANFIRSHKHNWNISFDNLALSQLRLRDALTTEQWETFYMGQDFSHSMYIDAVSQIFAPSSTLKMKGESWKKYNLDPVKYFKENKNTHSQYE